MDTLTQQELKRQMHYDPESGVFTRLVSNSPRVKVNSIAGCLVPEGYLVARVNKRTYLLHRLAWFYVHGEWPPEHIDHINRVRADNRLSNLRLANATENQQNKSIQKGNTSGYQGVGWHRIAKKWTARIKVDKKRIYLGLFERVEDAAAAYKQAKLKFHIQS